MLQPRLLIRSGTAVSIITHLAVLTVGLGYAGVRPFETVAMEAIAVDLVSPAEVKEAAKEAPPEKPPWDIPDLSAKDQPAAAPAPAAPPQSQQQTPAAPSPNPKSAARPAAAQPQPNPAPQPAPPPSPTTASWRPPEPDLSVKYQVNLGLPTQGPGNDFDAPAMSVAKVATSDIAKFREHLKTCSVLPGSIAATDKVKIVLRANLLPDGTLASAPLLIEASASAKGPLLMRAAIDALGACQPYAVLPADKYNEWKVLDLSFTPQDFRRG
jgi:outer membrane biosynthesis protein TonB